MEEAIPNLELNLKVRLEVNDFKTHTLRLARYAFFRNPINVLVAVLVALSIIHRINNAAVYYNSRLVILGGIIFLIGRGLWKFIYTNKMTKKVFKSDKIIQKEQLINITSTMITIICDESIEKIKWDEIYYVCEAEKQFEIYLALYKLLIIPKRFFEKDKDLSLMREIIKDVMPKKKRKRL